MLISCCQDNMHTYQMHNSPHRMALILGKKEEDTNKKPRVVRGSERLTARQSGLKGLVLAEQESEKSNSKELYRLVS